MSMMVGLSSIWPWDTDEANMNTLIFQHFGGIEITV